MRLFLSRLPLLALLLGGAALAQETSPPGATGEVLTGSAAFGDWRQDRPGLRRHITVQDLPAPYATRSASNGPSQSKQKPELKVPPGFHVALFAKGLEEPRTIRVAPNGDIFVVESGANRVRVYRAENGTPSPAEGSIFASGLDQPFGLAFYPPGPDPQWVYVANTNAVLRFPYRAGDLKARDKPETVIPKLTREEGGHWTRDLAFSRDGSRLFVSVGSQSNVAQGLGREPPKGAAPAPLGAAWGDEEGRADVVSFTPEGKDRRIYATGIRNCVGLAVHPKTGDLWCSTNERDGLGDDLVPDYVTRVKEGGFYGWPWFYLGGHEDPRHKGAMPALKDKVTVPDVLIQAHSASLGMAFYEGTGFPAGYRDSAFAALHGSWNRAKRTGYKIVRIPLKDGVPDGTYEDFVTGFVTSDNAVTGRPVGVATAKDGALLFSEDGQGTVWRVTADAAPR